MLQSNTSLVVEIKCESVSQSLLISAMDYSMYLSIYNKYYAIMLVVDDHA